jgi:hypothetical protein
VRAKLRRFLAASGVHNLLLEALNDVVADYAPTIEYIDLANAVVFAPDASYPFGSVRAGVPWYSTVMHVLVLLTKPAKASEGEFYEAAAKVVPVCDGILPSWCSFAWYRAPADGFAAVSVSGGPSEAGFYLDADHNLDNAVFDT